MDNPIIELALPVRAQLLREAYSRLTSVLTVHSNGYLLIFSEQVDQVYIYLLDLCQSILASPGFEELHNEFPKEIPPSLHEFGLDADIAWEYIQDPINAFTGKVLRFSMRAGATPDVEFEKIFFPNVDAIIQTFRKMKRDQEGKFFDRVEKQAEGMDTTRMSPASSDLISPEIVKNTRPYVEKILHQANGCYRQGWFDACAVMLRRLIETLIVECFENNGYLEELQDKDGSILPLDKLVYIVITSRHWNLGRDTKRSLKQLPEIKELGNHSAHNRRFIAQKNDLDRVILDIRVVVQELVHLTYPQTEKQP